ncbi:MAG: hypothetical protein EA353_02355, partial [Puniceicoccaceae bacterium]
MSATQESTSGARNYGLISLVVGIIGLVIGAFGLISGLGDGNVRPLLSWLLGISFWLSIAIGMLFMVLLFYIFHAKWATAFRRILEHGICVFPYLGILFLPLLIIPFVYEDPGILWKWMGVDREIVGGGTVSGDPLYLHKSPYLNIGFFTVRAIGVFVVFAALAFFLRRFSFNMDKTGDIRNFHNARIFSALGIFFCAAAMTVASIDWFKSLEYHWFSTMYGVWFFAASMRVALSVTLILLVVYSARGPLKGLFTQGHRYDLACMMGAFTIFWAYISFSQYFIIYNANIPEETFWYSIREVNYDGSLNSWWWVTMALIFFHFLLPFLFLLWYKNKVTVKRTDYIASWINAFHL